MDSNQISDQIVEAINIIAKKKIEAISFDTTIEATIIDDSRASEGIYMVSNGSASFEAVSTETGYKKNNAVLVTIPQGDYSKQKIIAGKQVNKTDNSPIVYQSPFKTILNMTNNLIGDTSKIGEIGIIANHPNKYCWDINTEKFTDSTAYTQTYKVEGENKIVALIWDSEDILSEGEFNHTQIGIKAQFSTWLEEYGIASGNYGLAAEIFFTHKDDVIGKNAGDTNITQDIIDSHSFSKIIYLDSDSFFGNVYNFESYYTQEKTYDISKYTDFPITRIRLFAYQRNNFKDINNNKIEYEKDFNSTDSFSSIMPNIFIKDPYICLGAPIEQFTVDSAEIITRQGYNYMQDPPELKIVNENDLESLSEQINDVLYDENDISISITQALKPFIRERHNLFYKYLKKVLLKKGYNREKIKDIFNALVASKNNNFDNIPAGYDWTKNKIKISKERKQPISVFLNNLLEEDNIAFSNEKTLELRWIHKNDLNEEVNVVSFLPKNYKIYWFKYKESIDEVENRHSLMDAHWDLLESKQEDDVFKITFNPNVKVGKERVQAIVVREDNGIEHLVVKSNVLELVNITETVSTATLTAVTRSLDDLAIRFDDGSSGNYFLYNRAKKLFSVEKNEVRTLTAVFDENEDIVENKKNLEGPCSVKWIIPANNTMIIPWNKQNNCRLDSLTINKNIYVIEEQLEENDKKSSFTYKINENLDYTKNNNTIILEVKKFDQTYFASATMRFGSAGTSGSDYTIVVNWSNDQAVFDISEVNNDSNYALSGEVNILDQDGKNIVNDNLNYEYSWYKVKSDSCNFDYVEETNEDLLYPINNNALGRFRIYDEESQEFRPYPNNEDENKIVTYCYANFLDAGYPSQSQNVSMNGTGDSFMINDRTSNNNEYVYYEYDLFFHDFKELKNTAIKINASNNENPRILYAKSNFQERNEEEDFYIFPSKRYKIQYKPFNNVYNKPFEKNNSQESGVIDIHTDGTIDYYYGSGSTKRKAFIKDKDRFIIDPYDRYYENLIYYYPTVVENEKKYNETTLIIEKDKNKFYIKKNLEKELNIDDLYIFQITITSGLTEYPLIARFPIALKQNLYKDSSGKILTKNELKEEEGERLFISTDGFKGATEIRYTTSGEVDFDKTQYSIHLSVWNEKNEQIKSEWANQDLQVGKWKINSENEQFSQFDSLINNKIMKQTCIDYLLDKLGREESNEYLTSDKWKNIQRVFDVFLSPADEQNSNKNLIIKYFTDKIYEDYIIKNKPWPSRMAESGFLKSRLENSSDVFLINFIKILEKIKVIQNSNFEILLNETPILSPSSIYFKDVGLYGIQFVLISDPENSSDLVEDNQKVLWTQPIYIYQDNYPSTTLNEWGGKEILTDNEKGLIVANGFSAGKKEADNTFTGVVIGDWSKSDTDEAITKQTGIYGFNHGIMSYALKDDGTAFFGADGSGRIYLNGNNAKIYSANWIKTSTFNNQSYIGNLYKQNQEGMMLDIDNGELLIQKKVGNISIVKDDDAETDYIYTSIQDNRKISLNENGLIISRRGFTLNSDGEIEDLGSEKRLFELEMNSQGSSNDDNIFYNFKYALRTPDYTYSNINSAHQTNGKIISGMEINFANQTITAFNSPNFGDDQPSFKQKGFKLQAGGQWDRTAQGTKGFKIIIDCQEDKVLKIGSSMPTDGSYENFYVKTNGEVKGTLLQGNIIQTSNGNFSVDTYGHLTCARIISKNKFLNFEGGLHIIGKDDQNDSLSCYKYYIDENHYDRGNIWCGEINCTSIKINGHTLTVGQPTSNGAPGGNSPKLCLDGYGIDY